MSIMNIFRSHPNRWSDSSRHSLTYPSATVSLPEVHVASGMWTNYRFICLVINWSHYRKFKIQDWSSRFKIQDSALYRKFKIQDSKVFFKGNSRFEFSKFSSDFSEGIQDSGFQSSARILNLLHKSGAKL